MNYDDSHEMMRIFESIVQKDLDDAGMKMESDDTGLHRSEEKYELRSEQRTLIRYRQELSEELNTDIEKIRQFLIILESRVLSKIEKQKIQQLIHQMGKEDGKIEKMFSRYLRSVVLDNDSSDDRIRKELHDEKPTQFEHPDRLGADNERWIGQKRKHEIAGPKTALPESDK